MEIILYQAPGLIEKKSLISERRMAGWAGLLSSFPRLRQNFSPARVFLVGAGNVLIVLALVGLFLSLGPLIKLEIGYRFKKEEKLQSVSQTHFDDLFSARPDNGREVVTSLEAPDVNFSLVIPKIKASSVIIPNVNASSEKEYNGALKKGIAHAAGTVFPGMKGTIFLFAHSTDAPWNIRRYNAVFYLLRELEQNDRIIIYYQGAKHYYSVSEKKIVDPSETYWFNQQDEEVLVLQTCYPPGTIKQALLIFAKPS